jgi:hypothetical protein
MCPRTKEVVAKNQKVFDAILQVVSPFLRTSFLFNPMIGPQLTDRKDPSEEAPQTPPVQEVRPSEIPISRRILYTILITRFSQNSASLSSRANAHSFLETFVGHVHLDNSWVAKVEAAGFTEDTMAEMANVPSLQIMDFLAAAFPEMTDVQRFLFATRIKGFNTAT